MTAKIDRVLIMAGGTGGHVFPALATARCLQAQGATVHWLGTRKGIESRIVPAAGIDITYLDVAGVRGQGMVRLLAAPVRIGAGILKTVRFMRTFKPDCVIGMGGFVTGPGGVAAWLSRIPLFIHEQNAIAGFTNRLLSRFARRVYQAFPGAFDAASGVMTVGNPVRTDIVNLPEPTLRWTERQGPIRVLVVGGSQGAVALNRLLPSGFALIPKSSLEIWHQAGAKNADSTREAYQAAGVDARVTEFIDDMAQAYAWADLVICRSGALTVSELAAAGVGAILVPYPHAVDDHQTLNARYLVDAGAATLIPQTGLDASRLAEHLRTHCLDRGRLLDMAQAARQLALPRSTEMLVEDLRKLLDA